MAKLVSKTYGDALFDLGIETSTIDELYNEVSAFGDVLNSNLEFRDLMSHPQISKEDKKSIIEKTLKDSFSSDLIGFVMIVLEKDRFDDMNLIIDYFVSRYKEYKNIGIIQISSAYDLDAKAKSKIEDKLLQTTKYDSLECEYIVDESLIAGLKIKIGDKIVDSTISTRLNQMSSDLYNIQLI